MKRNERSKSERDQMNPLRKKFINIALPTYLAVSMVPLAAAFPLMILEDGKYAVLIACLWAVWFALSSAGMLYASARMSVKEAEGERARYAYLFQEPIKAKDVLTVPDEELCYTLDKDGVRLEIPGEEGEQVFDELNENAFYVSWERADFAFATQSYMRRVYLAFAVFSIDLDAPPFFIPFNEEVYAFIKKKGFDKKLEEDWEYLFYDPEEAFKQILLRGRIVKYRDKKDGEPFRDKPKE